MTYNMTYARDTYDDSRESFYNFCFAFTKFNRDEYFEVDHTGNEYLNRNVEAAYQCWLHGFGFGYDKGAEDVHDAVSN